MKAFGWNCFYKTGRIRIARIFGHLLTHSSWTGPKIPSTNKNLPDNEHVINSPINHLIHIIIIRKCKSHWVSTIFFCKIDINAKFALIFNHFSAFFQFLTKTRGEKKRNLIFNILPTFILLLIWFWLLGFVLFTFYLDDFCIFEYRMAFVGICVCVNEKKIIINIYGRHISPETPNGKAYKLMLMRSNVSSVNFMFVDFNLEMACKYSPIHQLTQTHVQVQSRIPLTYIVYSVHELFYCYKL